MIRHQKLSDKTDSDATSGIGVELVAPSTSSDSENANHILDPFGDLAQFKIAEESSEKTASKLRRSSSIYDNLNEIDEALGTNDELDETDEVDSAPTRNDIWQQMDSITRMLDEVQFQIDKESTLRRAKKSRTRKEQTLDDYIEQNYERESCSNQDQTDESLQPIGLPSDGA